MQSVSPDAERKLYVAQTTADLREEAEKIRRELVGRGHKVLPSQPLSMLGDELLPQVSDYLSESSMSIHPVGKAYGVVPEGESESLIAIQNRLAAQKSQSGSSIVYLDSSMWRSRWQQVVVQALKTVPDLYAGSEIIQGQLPD